MVACAGVVGSWGAQWRLKARQTTRQLTAFPQNARRLGYDCLAIAAAYQAPMPQGPEQTARTQIDRLLQVAGWAVQGVSAVDLYGARGVAVREFPLTGGNDPRPHRRKSGHRARQFRICAVLTTWQLR